MKIIRTLNNIKLKYLYSWSKSEKQLEYGQDVLVNENGKIVFINWKIYNKTETLW